MNGQQTVYLSRKVLFSTFFHSSIFSFSFPLSYSRAVVPSWYPFIDFFKFPRSSHYAISHLCIGPIKTPPSVYLHVTTPKSMKGCSLNLQLAGFVEMFLICQTATTSTWPEDLLACSALRKYLWENKAIRADVVMHKITKVHPVTQDTDVT